MSSSLGSDAVRRQNTWRKNSLTTKRPRQSMRKSFDRHGSHANGVLEKSEHALFRTMIAKLYADFAFNRSRDFMAVEIIAVFYVKQARALAAGNVGAVAVFDGLIRSLMRDLKLTKSTGSVARTTAPAEWVADRLVGTEQDNGE